MTQGRSMSLYSKGFIGAVIGGPVAGAVARFLAAGEWTRAVALRHVGYAVFAVAATVLALELYAPLAKLSHLAIAALGAALVPVVARVLMIISKAAIKGRIFGFEFNTGDDSNDKQ
jgi:hypothetical protein